MIDNIGWLTLEFHTKIFYILIPFFLLLKLSFFVYNNKTNSKKEETVNFISTLFSIGFATFVLITWGCMFYIDLSGKTSSQIDKKSTMIADNGKIILTVSDEVQSKYTHYLIKCDSSHNRISLRNCFNLMKHKTAPELIQLSYKQI